MVSYSALQLEKEHLDLNKTIVEKTKALERELFKAKRLQESVSTLERSG